MDNNDGWLRLSPKEPEKITHKPKSLTPISDEAISWLGNENVSNDVRRHIYQKMRNLELELIGKSDRLARINVISRQ